MKPKKPGLKRWQLLLKVLFSILLLSVMLLMADVKAVWASLAGFQVTWLPIVLLLIGASVLVSAIKWGVLLHAQGYAVRLLSLFKIYLIALFFNNFLPSSIGGDGVRIVMSGQRCKNTAAAAASVVMERMLATVSLATLGLIGALYTQNPNAVAIGMLAALLLIGLLLSAILMTGWVPNNIRNSPKKVAKVWTSFSVSAGNLRKQPKALLANFLLSFAFQILVAAVVGATIAGLRLPTLTWFDLAFVTSASSVLAMVPIGLNGYGLREGAYVLLLTPFGYTAPEALSVSILFAIFVSVFSLSGGISWVMSQTPQKVVVGESQ